MVSKLPAASSVVLLEDLSFFSLSSDETDFIAAKVAFLGLAPAQTRVKFNALFFKDLAGLIVKTGGFGHL